MAKKKTNIDLKAGGRIWLNTKEGIFVGKGRVELLELIHELGSIRKAAIEMKMSYRQAWQAIDEMNAHAKIPIVISHRGGKGGGNAIVTESGQKLITIFNTFSEEFQIFINKQQKKFIF